MTTLFVFNTILILIISAILLVIAKFVKTARAKNVILLISPLVTILYHYSGLVYHGLVDGTSFAHLQDNPNLILPIYPCNVVMWSCLIFGLLPNKKTRFAEFLADYIFWFGLISTLVGMFANVDFIMNPTLADFDITKSIVAHATLLLNVLLMAVFGYTRIDFVRNMKNITVSVIAMYVIGLYCNLVFRVLVSSEAAYDVNSMFIIHSPFESVPYLTYPIIAAVGLVIYFIVFTVCELIARKRGERWFDRVIEKFKKK